MGEVKSLPGTYALVLHSRQSMRVSVGHRGDLDIRPGYYIYIGSAFGPGGVRARVSRHCRDSKAKHWHIDYLREYASPVDVWCSYDPEHLEHRWAGHLQQAISLKPVNGFGCSDCECKTHLFFAMHKPELSTYASMLGGDVEACRLDP